MLCYNIYVLHGSLRVTAEIYFYYGVQFMKERLWTPEFLGMSFSSLFQSMTHYSLITVLPILIINEFAGNAFEAGLAMTFFQIGTVLARPFAGKLVDACNKKKVLIVILSAFCLVNILYSFISNLSFLLGLRFLHGMIFAVGTTSVATVAALVLPNSRKGEGIGYFAVFTNLAMVIGPFTGLFFLMHFGYVIFFIFVALLGVLVLFSGVCKKLDDSVTMPARNSKKSFSLKAFVEPKVFSIVLISGLVYFSYSGVLVYIPVYLKHLDLVDYSSAFFAAFALIIVVTRPFIGKIFDAYPPKYLIYPGLLLFFCGFICLSVAQTVFALIASAVIIGAGFGALSSSFQTMSIQAVPLERAGVATATYFWGLDISVGLGSFFLGILIKYTDYSGMYQFAALVTVIAAVLFFMLFRKNKYRNDM